MNQFGDKKLICEACRSEFTCSAASGSCWCFELEVAPKELLGIEKKYDDCLCQACLSKISLKFDEQDFTGGKTSL